ncbi:hypothetical protein J2W51_003450 [Tardiphaga robiniae]|nr:hypothetical protein [Tardiphaga robiniae]
MLGFESSLGMIGTGTADEINRLFTATTQEDPT